MFELLHLLLHTTLSATLALTILWLWPKLRRSWSRWSKPPYRFSPEPPSRPSPLHQDQIDELRYSQEVRQQAQVDKWTANYLKSSFSKPPGPLVGLMNSLEKPIGSLAAPLPDGPTENPPAAQQAGTQMGQELGFLPSDSCTSSIPSGGSEPTRPAEKTRHYGASRYLTSDVLTPSIGTTRVGAAGPSSPSCGCMLGEGTHYTYCPVFLAKAKAAWVLSPDRYAASDPGAEELPR